MRAVRVRKLKQQFIKLGLIGNIAWRRFKRKWSNHENY